MQQQIDNTVQNYFPNGLKKLLKVRASDGKSALHWSYEYSNVYLTNWLISKKFDQGATDIYNKIPKDYDFLFYAAPKMTKQVLQTIVTRVKEKNILLAAEGYVQGKTGWYVNRQGGLLWYDVVDGEWIRVKERQIDGRYRKNNKKKKKKKKKKHKKKSSGRV